MKSVLYVIPLILIVTACSEPVQPVSEQPVQEKMPLENYQDSIEKAKQVEKQLLEAAEKKKKAIDDQLQ